VGQETVAVDNQYVEPVGLGGIVVVVVVVVVHRGIPHPSTVFAGRGIGLLDAGEVGIHLAFHYCSPF